MGFIEKLPDGRSIEHSQYGDFHYDKKGKLTEFLPKSRLNYLLTTLGIKRVCELIGYRLIDEFGPYQVIDINLGRDRQLYLKMTNPSTKEIHFEGVPNECNTVEAALKWRNKSNELPINLT